MSKEKNLTNRINFLEKQTFAVSYRLVFIVIFIFLFSLLSVYGGMKFWLMALNGEEEKLVTEVTRLKSEQERIKKEAEEKGSQSKAKSLLQEELSHAINWPRLLRELTSHTPQKLWLIEINTSEKGKKNILSIKGSSYQADSVTEFIKSLSSSTYFDKIVLKSSRENKTQNGNFYEFSIDVLLKSHVKEPS